MLITTITTITATITTNTYHYCGILTSTKTTTNRNGNKFAPLVSHNSSTMRDVRVELIRQHSGLSALETPLEKTKVYIPRHPRKCTKYLNTYRDRTHLP
jgi:hypothetical protein